MNKAKYVTDITVTDPDTKAPVEVTIFKHENGGMFGIDASYIDSIDEGEEFVIISDPFNENDNDENDTVDLYFDNAEFDCSEDED
jgi:hypothetical protein